MHRKGMDCYWQTKSCCEIWSLYLEKTKILPGCNCVSTNVWLHHLNFTKQIKKKVDGTYTRMLQATWKLLEAPSNKTVTIWPFANGPGDLGSIPGRVIPKTQKMVLDASLLNTQHYKVQINGKVEQSREGVAPSPTHWCSSYRKGSLRVTLDYGR